MEGKNFDMNYNNPIEDPIALNKAEPIKNLERTFSKELAQDLRDETAHSLRAARNLPDNFKDLDKEMKGIKDLPAGYDGWREAKETFAEMRKNIWGKIFQTEKYKEQEVILNNFLKFKKEDDLERVQRNYQKKFDEILQNCPLTPEEREKYLSTEAMEKMPLEDYLVLLKRLSGEAFYHVTRYGIRENTFASHTTGEGELVDGFTPLLKDGKINSCTATIISNKERAKHSINKKFLQESKEEGLSVDEVVDKVLKGYDTDYFLDRESVHFSYGKDLHKMYGGENNYKFYFYYPVEYILQNDFSYSTREGQLTIGNGYIRNSGGIEQQYNDFEIFNFGKGVPVDAGILCISDDVRVDPETGSQYLLQNGKPVADENGELKKPEKTISSQEYWENYFKLNPELKPNKIIYGRFGTGSYYDNKDLKDWAETKKIYKQPEDKKQEFEEYLKDTKKILKEIFTEVVSEEFDSK
ncbi:MAG: hypothetical protein WCJ57_00125 [Candidatus Falkowbacteria bacterium]